MTTHTTASKMPNWSVLAAALPTDEFKGTMPISVFLGEAIDLVKFCRQNWTTQYDKKTKAILRRGLDLAGKDRLPPSTGAELEDLAREAQEAQTAYVLTVDAKAALTQTVERGQFLVQEMMAALEWLFDDGVEDENDAKLANVEATHKDDPATPDAIALALEDYATLADAHRKELSGIGAFDLDNIEEARALAKELRLMPEAVTASSRVALAKRNRLLQLLQDRISRVRAAAKFVYRNEDSMIRQVTSTFERKRRAQARRAAMKKGKDNGTPVESPVAPAAAAPPTGGH